MRNSKTVKMLLCSSAAVGLSSLVGNLAMGQTSYTFNQLAGGAQTWALAANWNQAAGPDYPGDVVPGGGAANDVANLNVPLSAPLTIALPGGTTPTTVSQIILGDSSGGKNLTTVSGYSVTGPVLTLDSGQPGVAAVITENTSGTISNGTLTVNILANHIVANSDVTINVNNGDHSGNGQNGLLFGDSNGSFDATGHTVSIYGGGHKFQTEFYCQSTAALWIVESQGKLGISGNYYTPIIAGDVNLMAGGKIQNYGNDQMGHADLVTMDGEWNMGGASVVIGGLQGTSGDWGGPGPLTIDGGTDAVGNPNFAGSLSVSSLTVNGGTQQLSGTTANDDYLQNGGNHLGGGTGPVVVNGGVLQLNKTNPGSGRIYAIGTASTYSGSYIAGPSLAIHTGGSVELMQPNQLDPVAPITIDTKGTLKLDTGSGTTTISNVITLNVAAGTGGYIDVNTEKLVLTASTGITPAAAFTLIKNAYAGGTWSGYGITSSAAAANPHTGLAYTTDGSGDTVIFWDLLGDTDFSGSVNFNDLLTLAQNYGHSNVGWAQGDSDYNNSINFNDLLSLAQNYGHQISGSEQADFSPSFAAAWNLALSEVGAVPEPTSLSLLAIGAASLLTRRRRQMPMT